MLKVAMVAVAAILALVGMIAAEWDEAGQDAPQ